MHEYCRSGGKAMGYNSADDCYTATCGNHNWSGLAAYVDCTAEATPDPACLENGERIKTQGVLQDVTQAIQATCPGGTVYMPKFQGKKHGIYVWRGCQVAGDTCPTSLGGEYYLRTVSLYSGIRMLGEGVIDVDGPEINGRVGSWWIDDGGNVGAQDPDGSGRVLATQRFHASIENGLRICDPDGAGGCNLDSTIHREVGSKWGNDSSLTDDMGYNDVSSGYTELCVDNGLGNTGTCSGKRTVACTSTAVCTANGIGTCQGFVTAVEAEVDAGNDVWLSFHMDAVNFDKTAATNGAYLWVGKVRDADDTANDGPAGACTGDGKNIYLGNPEITTHQFMWGFDQSELDISSHAQNEVYVLDWEKYNNGPGYNFEKMNFMPQNWCGRNSSDNDEDCTAWDNGGGCAGTACDTGMHFRHGYGRGGGFKDNAFWYMSTESFSNIDDGGSIGTKFHDNIVSHVKRNVIGDWGAWDVRGNLFTHFEDDSSNMITVYSHDFTSQDNVWSWNGAKSAYRTTWSKGFRVIGDRFYGGNYFSFGIFYLKNGGYGLVKDIIVRSMEGSLAQIDVIDGEDFHHWTFRDIFLYGGPNKPSNVTAHGDVHGYAVIRVTDQDLGGNDGGGNSRNVLIDNVHAQTDAETCLVWFDAGDDDAAGGAGANLGVEAQMAGYTITNSSIEGTNAKLACFGQDNDIVANNHYASNAADVLDGYTAGPTNSLPFIQNNMVNGVPSTNFPYRTSAVAAAAAGDCDTIKHDTVVIISDDTGAQACDDSAPADGVLDGGGATTSICICNRETTNWIPYF
jgi:hypothetical protein